VGVKKWIVIVVIVAAVWFWMKAKPGTITAKIPEIGF